MTREGAIVIRRELAWRPLLVMVKMWSHMVVSLSDLTTCLVAHKVQRQNTFEPWKIGLVVDAVTCRFHITSINHHDV